VARRAQVDAGEVRTMTVTEGRAFTCGLCGQTELRAIELIEHQRGCRGRRLLRRPGSVGPCPCECNSGGFCGGCGHAGCGGRR
jgi:hypothetical protein